MRTVTDLPQYRLGPSVLTIFDSYKTHKRDMKPILAQIAMDNLDVPTTVFERSFFSMKMEWICHKFLYKIGYERERTKDVDLDNPCDRPEWKYELCGLLVWPFVW